MFNVSSLSELITFYRRRSSKEINSFVYVVNFILLFCAFVNNWDERYEKQFSKFTFFLRLF